MEIYERKDLTENIEYLRHYWYCFSCYWNKYFVI